MLNEKWKCRCKTYNTNSYICKIFNNIIKTKNIQYDTHYEGIDETITII